MIKLKKSIATSATRQLPFAGDAGADLQSARTVWKKISGECPATELHGSALTAAARTGSEISKNPEINQEEFLQALLILKYGIVQKEPHCYMKQA